MKAEEFPSPDCPEGYSWGYIEEILDGETFTEFCKWMYGQTCTICDGKSFNHETREYEATVCADNPHGGVAYSWDLRRFMGFHGRVAKDLWD